MNKLVVVNIFIVLSHIFIFVNLTTANKGLFGEASCRYLGGFDPKNKKCHKDKVKFDKLPQDCSAYIYDGVQCTSGFEIVSKNSSDLDNISSLIKLRRNYDDLHDVYVIYKHDSLEAFGNVIYLEQFHSEAEAVCKFIGNYPVKGLILEDIEYPIKNKDSDNFYTNFTAYVTAIRSENPGLEIGLYLSARNFTHIFMNGNSASWFDFGKMNDILDFYIIEFATFNECVDQLLYGGITPFDSSDENIMTLNKFVCVYMDSTIDASKVYFEFLIRPITKPGVKDEFLPCEVSYNEFCENSKKYHSIWCVDTQDQLYRKGAFSRYYSKGFIGREIDLVDRDNKCECNDKYITFSMMVKGFKKAGYKLVCDAFK